MLKRNILLAISLVITTIAGAQEYRNVPLQSTIKTAEPFKGITFWSTNGIAHGMKSAYALEFAYCLPCKVVTGKVDGQITYDWTSLENLLNEIKGRKHKAIIRFRYEYPGGEPINGVTGATAVPQYIKDLPDYNETYKANAGGSGPTYYADWSNEELKWFTKQFFTDFAARYDNDPRLAYVQVGFGHWSEYHIYDGTSNPYRYGVNFPTKAYQREFFAHLDSTFSVTPWSVGLSSAEVQGPASETAIQALHFGIFDDSFMHQNHEIGSASGYNESLWVKLKGYTDRWKLNPCGGEISYYSARDQHEFLRPETGIYGISWEEAAAKYHITYMIGNNAVEGAYAYPVRIKEACQHSGYSFRITAYRVSDTEAEVEVTNAGIAPCYFDVYPTVAGVRSDTSLKGLLPGQSALCRVTGLNIAPDTNSKLTITGDKLYSNETVPYAADLSGDASVESIMVEDSAPAEYYTLDGRRILDPASVRGLVIVKRGPKIAKQIL